MNKNKLIFVGYAIWLITLSVACDKYEPLTYTEIRERMHTTYKGTLYEDQNTYEEIEMRLEAVDDSVSIIYGLQFDSLLVKVTSVFLNKCGVVCHGDSVSILIYDDEHSSLFVDRYEDNPKLVYFEGERKK
ncbi:MAG TPA: hypothetical protein VI603_08445 [Saprospiraceae bacterium]|nr:hypothetical protein [Saprospiraceae bacterium]